MPVFSQFRAWHGGFQILKRLFFNKADKIPPLTRSGYRQTCREHTAAVTGNQSDHDGC